MFRRKGGRKLKRFDVIITSLSLGDEHEELLRRVWRSGPENVFFVSIGEVPSSLQGKAEFIMEKKRSGKSKALNMAMEYVKSPVVLLLCGDVMPEENSIEMLIEKIEGDVVAAGSRPIPEKGVGLASRIAWLIWELHHRICLRKPKLSGEMFAMKSKEFDLPDWIINDDAWLQSKVEKKGNIVYEPKAVVKNRGERKILSLFKQRSRIALGYIQMKKEGKDFKKESAFGDVIELIREHPNKSHFILAGCLIELSARAWARVSAKRGKFSTLWEK